MARGKQKLEYRYYEMPENEQILALLGDEWVRVYGAGYLHFHNFMEIGVCRYGCGEVIIEDAHYTFHDTQATIIPPNVPHESTTAGERAYWEWMYIDIDSVLREMYPDDELLAKNIKSELYENAYFFEQGKHPALMNVLNAIIQEAKEQDYMYRESIKGLLRAFVVGLLRMKKCEKNLKRVGQSMLIISPAIDYARTHYQEAVKISEMAEVCNISESHFRKVFQEYMGMRPSDFLNIVRIQKACDLMAVSDRSVENISYEVGFANVTGFIRNFKKFLGVTPYQWKKSDSNYEGKLRNYKVSAQKGWS